MSVGKGAAAWSDPVWTTMRLGQKHLGCTVSGINFPIDAIFSH
jgi:hypothetical protein